MKAVILNAGEGKRLRPLTTLKPKCLLRLNTITILEHQLNNLIECGIEKVIIVVGYLANQIFEAMNNKNFPIEIEFIQNPIYFKTNTIYSLWLARKHIKDDFVYLNGDVVFDEKILERLLKSSYKACIAVDKRQVGREEVKVHLVSNLVKRIGKNIEASKAHGEFIGIAKFSKKFNQLLINKLDEIIKEGMVNEFFEVAVDQILKDYHVYAIDVSDLLCIEVDTHEDFNIAKKIYLEIVKTGK